MMTRACIRTFEDRDVASANALTNTYIRETAIHFGLHEATDSEFRTMWQSGSARFPWLAAEVDGCFAGYAKAGVWREREAYAGTVETGVYVETSFHRCGVGRALYSELFVRLRAADFHTVIAGIALPNDASVRMHEACGFAHVGTCREVGRKFGRWWDVGFWQAHLHTP